MGTSVPQDTNTVITTSQDPNIVNCINGVCTARNEGTTNIVLSFPVTNQTANLPVEERVNWGLFTPR